MHFMRTIFFFFDLFSFVRHQKGEKMMTYNQSEPEIIIQQLKEKLETAAYVERLLPKVKVNGYIPFAVRFTIKYSPQEIMFMDKKPIRLTPTREQITLWEKVVLEWLPLLSAEERNLVWKRANRIPWKLLSREFNVSRQILALRLNKALHKIGYTFWVNNQKCFYMLLQNILDFSPIIIYNIDIRKHKFGGKTCLD